MSDATQSVTVDTPSARAYASLVRHPLACGFVLLVLVHAPTLWAYGVGLAGRDHYQFFPVMWIALVVFVLTRGSSALVTRWYHALLLGLDVLCLIVASLYRSPWFGFAGFCGGCLALLWAGRDRVTGRSLWPLVLLPLMTLRPPLNFDTQIITRLQLTTTQVASAIIDRMGVLHYRRGVILELPDRELFIDEACSGIHSLFTLLGLAALIILIHRRHWLMSLLLLASAVIWALLLNIVRVVTLVLANLWLGIDLASGWRHDVLGFVLVGIALVCLLSTDQLLLLVFARILPGYPEDEEVAKNLLVRAFNRFFRPPAERTRPVPESSRPIPAGGKLRVSIVVAGAMLMLAQGVGFQPRLQAGSVPAGDLALGSQTLAEQYDGWKRGQYQTERRSTESMWGERSRMWDYSHGPRSARVSLDYPFQGWHELVNCYRNTGWQISRREVRRDDAAAGDWPLVVVVMQDETGRHATLCYSVFDADGNSVLPARDELTAGVVDRWKRSTGRLGTYQVQTFSTGLTPPGDEDLEEVTGLHCAARRDLVRAVAGVEE